jgi:small-conductance mechanosensitive channel
MWYKLLMPATIVVCSVLAGLIIDRLLVSKLFKMAEKTRFKTDHIIIGAFKNMGILWLAMAGTYTALQLDLSGAVWMGTVTNAYLSVAILSVTIVVMRITTGLVTAYSQRAGGDQPSISLFANLAKMLVLIIGIVVMLQNLGISITPILTALGVGGLAVALALQDTLSNIFAGIHIILSRQIKAGDYVKLDSGAEGYITDISWRNTSILTMSNNMILVPNLKLSGAIVTNYELPGHEMSVVVNGRVSYSSDLEHVERVVSDVANEMMLHGEGGVPEGETLVRFNSFSDFSIDFSVILRTESFSDQYVLKHEFIKKLHRRFKEEGIDIPMPVRNVYIKNEE